MDAFWNGLRQKQPNSMIFGFYSPLVVVIKYDMHSQQVSVTFSYWTTHWSAKTIKPPAKYCRYSRFPCPPEIALMLHDMDSTRPLMVCSAVRHLSISSRSLKSYMLQGGPSWIGLVCPTHPRDTWSDEIWNLWNLEVNLTPWTISHVPQKTLLNSFAV